MVTLEVQLSKEQMLGFTHTVQYVGMKWEAYEAISEELGENSPIHITYHNGSLFIKPITKPHEMLVRGLERLIGVVTRVTRIPIYTFGSASLRSYRRLIGVEPDLTFYIGKAPSDSLVPKIENEVKFPPDIVVEIEISNLAVNKFSIYSELGIPEFWRFTNGELRIYILNDEGEYIRSLNSGYLPVVSEKLLSEFINRGATENPVDLLDDFENALRTNK